MDLVVSFKSNAKNTVFILREASALLFFDYLLLGRLRWRVRIYFSNTQLALYAMNSTLSHFQIAITPFSPIHRYQPDFQDTTHQMNYAVFLLYECRIIPSGHTFEAVIFRLLFLIWKRRCF